MLLLQIMAERLAEADLPVPAEIDTETIHKTELDKCMAAKAQGNKRPAAEAKSAKQAAGDCLLAASHTRMAML